MLSAARRGRRRGGPGARARPLPGRLCATARRWRPSWRGSGERPNAGEPVHILQIGDSHTAGDMITSGWRGRLQAALRQWRPRRARRRPALSGLSHLGRHRLAERAAGASTRPSARATATAARRSAFPASPRPRAPPARRSASPPIPPTRISTASSSARSPSPARGTRHPAPGRRSRHAGASTRRSRAPACRTHGQRRAGRPRPRSPPRTRGRSASPPSAPSGGAAASSFPISAWSAPSSPISAAPTMRCSAPSSPPTGPI